MLGAKLELNTSLGLDSILDYILSSDMLYVDRNGGITSCGTGNVLSPYL